MIVHFNFQIINIISINYMATHHASLERVQTRSHYTTTYAATHHVLCPTKKKRKREGINQLYVYSIISIIPLRDRCSSFFLYVVPERWKTSLEFFFFFGHNKLGILSINDTVPHNVGHIDQKID